MFRLRMLMVVVVGVLAASCSSDNSKQLPQPTQMKPQEPPKYNAPDPQKYKPPGGANAAPAKQSSPTAASNQPVPPKGAQYTIFCYRIDVPNHVQAAERLRNDLSSQTNFKEWHVMHSANESLLYYGYYRTIDDASKNEADRKEAARAQLDRNKIASMVDPQGNRLFKGAIVMPLQAPDPVAPPEWNLANAPGDLTLQIGTYKDHPQRKEAAVEAVREARKNNIEAYYYHGATASTVCVGHWPRSALVMDDGIPKNSEEKYMAAPATENPALRRKYEEAAAANGATLAQTKVIAVDPTLKAMINEFPYNIINGERVKRVSEGESAYVPSVVVEIPRLAPSGIPAVAQDPLSPAQAAYQRLMQSQPPVDMSQPAPARTTPVTPIPQQPLPQQPANNGRLRSIGG